jgi:hypothetical protein
MIVRTGADLPIRALTNTTYQECLDFTARNRPVPASSYESEHRFFRLSRGLSKFTERSPAEAVAFAYGLLADVASAQTRWSIVFDTGNRIFHLKSSLNRRLRSIDLSRIDFSCGSDGGVMLDAHAPLEGDITKAFRPYSHEEAWKHIVKALAHFRPNVSEDTIRSVLGLFESFSCESAGQKTAGSAASVISRKGGAGWQ